jgi:hypothetical protein
LGSFGGDDGGRFVASSLSRASTLTMIHALTSAITVMSPMSATVLTAAEDLRVELDVFT